MRRSTAVLALALVLTGCSAPDDTDPTPSGVAGETSIVTGLDAPWEVVFVDRAPLVSERDSGSILEIVDGRTREAGRIAGVRHGGEGGLLGLAATGRHLFVYSTGPNGNRIERYEVTGEPGSLGLGLRVTLLDGIPSASTHNGGRLAVGPDGMLYAGTGDAGDRTSAQNRAALSGKILRMTPDGGVPDDNPIPGSLVYSYGHRNVQGLAWAADGRMFATEFGQNTWDELNLIEPGKNYGWPRVEGRAGDAAYVDPLQQWATDEASPSGAAVLGDRLYIANLRGRVLRAVPLADPSTSTELLDGSLGRLRTVVPGPDGALWVVTNNTDGRGTPRDPTS